MLTWPFRDFMEIIACFFVLVYPTTCLAGQAKAVFKLRGFYRYKRCAAYGKKLHCSLDDEQLIVTMQ